MSRVPRVAFGRFAQETNSFNLVPTSREDFESFHLVESAELLDHLEGPELAGLLKKAELKGFLRGLGAADLVPMGSVWALPGGPQTRACYDGIIADLLAPILAAGPLDGVYLCMHGAMGVEGLFDPEADLLSRVREIVGGVPIVVSFDLHANVTPEDVELSSLLIAYQTNPHRDHHATGMRAGQLLVRLMDGAIQPVSVLRQLPMLTGGGTMSDLLGAMRSVFARLRQIQRLPGVLHANLYVAHWLLDAPAQGWKVLVSTDGDPELATTLADELADLCWATRHVGTPRLYTVQETLDSVRARTRARRLGTIVVVDAGDCVGAGGAGDHTGVLRDLLDGGRDLTAYVPVRDAEVVRNLWDLEEGARVTTLVGGRLDPSASGPVEVCGTLVSKATGPDGRRVVLECGNATLFVTERACPVFRPGFFTDLGFSLWKPDFVLVKNAFVFWLTFWSVTRGVIYTGTDGSTSFARVRGLFQHVPRPIHPLDEIADWRQGAEQGPG